MNRAADAVAIELKLPQKNARQPVLQIFLGQDTKQLGNRTVYEIRVMLSAAGGISQRLKLDDHVMYEILWLLTGIPVAALEKNRKLRSILTTEQKERVLAIKQEADAWVDNQRPFFPQGDMVYLKYFFLSNKYKGRRSPVWDIAPFKRVQDW